MKFVISLVVDGTIAGHSALIIEKLCLSVLLASIGKNSL